MSKILITGSNGFIGKYLISKLTETLHDVITLNKTNGDIADANTWNSLPSVDIVIHLASKTFVPDSWANPSEFINTNLNGTICCLEYCRKHNSKLIYFSSYLYGNSKDIPINEQSKLLITNPYALSKKMAEDSCIFYHNNFAIDIIILRPFNVYGPGQSNLFLIPLIINQIYSKNVINVMDLSPKRDFVFIDDVYTAILKALNLHGFNIFNIGSGKSYSVMEIINITQKLANTSLNIVSGFSERNNEISDTIADISNARKILKWIPKWTIEDGILHTLTEYKKDHFINT